MGFGNFGYDTERQLAEQQAAQAAAQAEADKAARVQAQGEALARQRAIEADAAAQQKATEDAAKAAKREADLAAYRAARGQDTGTIPYTPATPDVLLDDPEILPGGGDDTADPREAARQADLAAYRAWKAQNQTPATTATPAAPGRTIYSPQAARAAALPPTFGALGPANGTVRGLSGQSLNTLLEALAAAPPAPPAAAAATK